MNRFIKSLERELQGQPENVVTVLLLVSAGLIALIALTAPVSVKAVVLAWIALP